MKKKGSVLLGIWMLLTAAFSMPILSSCGDGVEISFATATAEEIEPITRKVGDLYGKLPVPTREGYTFLGWKTEKMGGEYARRSVKVEKDIDHTLYAKWRKDEEEIPFPLEVKKERMDGKSGATFYIDENGQMFAWGKNDQGQVGDGTTEDRLSPVAVMTDKKWAQVDGDSHGRMYGIDEEGGLWSWGTRKKNVVDTYDTTPPQLTPERIMPNKKFCAIETGRGFYRHFALALDINGGLWAWGDNYYGQLGQGGENSGATDPWTDSGDDTPVRIKKDMRFVEISTDGETCGAIDEEGKLWLWGDNLNGELGSGKIYDGDDLSTSMSWLSSSTPTVAIETEGVRFAQIYCGTESTHAIDNEGNIWACGENDNAQFGNGTRDSTTILKQITQDVRFIQLVTGFALDEYGGLWIWGAQSKGLLNEFSCMHFESPPRHDKKCDTTVLTIRESDFSLYTSLKVNVFFVNIYTFYVLDEKECLWGGFSQVEASLTYRRYVSLGNGTSGWGSGITFHNPVKIIDEGGVVANANKQYGNI